MNDIYSLILSKLSDRDYLIMRLVSMRFNCLIQHNKLNIVRTVKLSQRALHNEKLTYDRIRSEQIPRIYNMRYDLDLAYMSNI